MPQIILNQEEHQTLLKDLFENNGKLDWLRTEDSITSFIENLRNKRSPPPEYSEYQEAVLGFTIAAREVFEKLPQLKQAAEKSLLTSQQISEYVDWYRAQNKNLPFELKSFSSEDLTKHIKLQLESPSTPIPIAQIASKPARVGNPLLIGCGAALMEQMFSVFLKQPLRTLQPLEIDADQQDN